MRMSSYTRVAVLVIMVGTMAACAPTPGAAPAAQQGAPVQGQVAAGGQKTLALATRIEVSSLSPAPFWQRRFTFLSTPRLFNASLAILDQHGVATPYLAESLPQLNTESWRVLPDGRMETTYTLKPNLNWQDGTPLAAEDFAFAYRVLNTPELGGAASLPQSLMEDVTAPDPRTVLIRWKQPYPDAGALTETFEPFPRHLLEQAFERGQPEAFVGLPYWTRDYVGLGPYKVDRWEPDAFIDGVAYDGHALGRPKIDRIHVVFISDPNTTMANLLAGGVQIAIEGSLRFQQASVLEREWAPTKGGTVLMSPSLWRGVQIQLRPEYASPRSLLDVRVRQALAASMDRDALNGAVLEGRGAVTDTMISPLVDYSSTIEQAAVKHPYDPRRAEQLMNDAGFTKGADGMFTSASERFTPELRVLNGAQQQQELTLLLAGWRENGFDVQGNVLSAAQGQDAQAQATQPALFAGGAQSGPQALAYFTSSAIPSAENRWTGRNFGGWSNPDYDRLADAFVQTLDAGQRVQQMAQLNRIIGEELPVIPMYFSVDGVAHVAALHGPQIVAPDSAQTWNVQEWTLE